jgi:hypothetical protein
LKPVVIVRIFMIWNRKILFVFNFVIYRAYNEKSN